MPNVLIIGATGYIGLPLAESLVRTGNHTVYGLARSSAKAQELAKREIIPVFGDAGDPSTFEKILSSAPIDVVVDASAAYEHATAILDTYTRHARQRAEDLTKEGIAACSKPAFVYVSGTWVHGSPAEPVSDLHPVGSATWSKGTPLKVVEWRPRHEQKVLAARDVLDVAILRPGEVYGRGSWLFGAFFKPLIEAKREGVEKLVVPTTAEAAPAVVHVDDVADALVRAVERVGGGGLGSWPVFDIFAEVVYMKTLMEKGQRVLGLKGEIEYQGHGGDAFMEAMAHEHQGSAARANMLLGWAPKRRNMLQDLKVLLKAFEANQA